MQGALGSFVPLAVFKQNIEALQQQIEVLLRKSKVDGTKIVALARVLVGQKIVTQQHLDQAMREVAAADLARLVDEIRFQQMPAEKAVQMARELGVPEEIIEKGLVTAPLTDAEKEALADLRRKMAGGQPAVAEAEGGGDAAPAEEEDDGEEAAEAARETVMYSPDDLIVVRPFSAPEDEIVVAVISEDEMRGTSWGRPLDDGGAQPGSGERFVCWRRSVDHLPEGADRAAESVHVGWSPLKNVVRRY